MTEPLPPMIKVQSSNVDAVGLLGDQLHIRFKSGHYVYEGVPAEIFRNLMEAESVGRFVAQEVKGKFPSRKL